MRLDHYLPTLKRANKADRKPPGRIRRVLEHIGPTMASAPVRRVIQTVCFIAFLVSFFYICWPYTARPASTAETPATEAALDALLAGEKPWPSHYADDLVKKEVVPADLFLRIDPLVSLSTSIASRSWVYSLVSAGIILLVCIFIPRGFCGYLCPLGTLIDLFDWVIGRRVKRFRVKGDGWWVHIKYYILLGTLIAAAFGVLISGFFSAIPVITRGLLFLGEPVQTGLLRGWHLVVPFHIGHVISLLLFVGVLCLGLLRPRFWCKYVCPSGAVFSVANLFRVSERKVEDSCIKCRKCVDICPFDAIKPDFTTRTTDCTLCQTCGGVCPTLSIKFVDRWDVMNLKKENEPPTHETPLGRRGFVSLATGSALAVTGGVAAKAATSLWGADLDNPQAFRPVRPPGSVPEKEFLQMCIRCGECFKACPNNVLHAEGFEQGFEGLWTPMVKADWAGCESSCNACGQVCPTGAIQPLPLEVKKKTRMALAEVNLQTCLPHAGKEACQLCVDDCTAAGYNAIEFIQVHTKTDANGNPVEGTGYVAPVVLDDKCIGCGLCQTRCHGINVLEKGLLKQSAIVISAGPGKEDRGVMTKSE
ncbi:MAG: 4Fe-4S binding protein [Verrucomicrobiaceae bacterium]